MLQSFIVESKDDDKNNCESSLLTARGNELYSDKHWEKQSTEVIGPKCPSNVLLIAILKIIINKQLFFNNFFLLICGY